VKFTRRIAATGESTEPYGKMPAGFLNYGRDGHMMTIVVGEGRPAPADPARISDQERTNLYKTMFAYAGTFTFDGKTITHHVDVSYNQFWTGTDLVRQAKLEGNKLTLVIDPEIGAVDGKLASFEITWGKVK
jgi:Lipocalin-like domain